MQRYLIPVIVPLTFIILAIPMILEKVPRNRFYGFRTPYTMSSDEAWYKANKISGIALLVAGIVWLGLGLLLPHFMAPEQRPYQLVVWLGTAVLGVAIGVSVWLTYRK